MNELTKHLRAGQMLCAAMSIIGKGLDKLMEESPEFDTKHMRVSVGLRPPGASILDEITDCPLDTESQVVISLISDAAESYKHGKMLFVAESLQTGKTISYTIEELRGEQNEPQCDCPNCRERRADHEAKRRLGNPDELVKTFQEILNTPTNDENPQ